MKEDKALYFTVDYILNHAEDHDIEVICKALEKRAEGRRKGPQGINVNHLAHSMGETIEQQISVSKDAIDNIVREYICDMVRKEQPDISDHDLNILLEHWLPSEKAKNKKNISEEPQKQLPPSLILKMVDQFMRFSTDQMPAWEQADLREGLPEWQEQYWRHFPKKIRGLITLYLKEKIDGAICWREIQRELFGVDDGRSTER